MKTPSIIALSTLSLFLFSGCGNSEVQESPDSSQTDVTQTVVATPSLTPDQEEIVKEYASEEKDPLAELLKPIEKTETNKESYLLEKDEFLAKWKSENGVLIDLRTSAEIEELPMLDSSAKNFNVYTPDFAENFRNLDQEASYFIYCAHANRSASVYNSMRKAGFENVYELKGGIN